MRVKTIIIVLITVILTAVLMQNTDNVDFKFLWATFRASKLIVLAFTALIAFILGVLVGRPKRVKRLGDDHTDDNTDKGRANTLSDDDKDYISRD
jgi:uncharacterized integral membrane protein